MQKITPCPWFDTEGEDAARFYTSIFPNSRIVDVARYGSAGPRAEGSVMTVAFELDGQEFIALNGGPDFEFNEAISLSVDCESQEEVDRYWDALTDGGEPGLVGYYKFDEMTGTTTADSVTTAGHTPHPGTLKAATTSDRPTFLSTQAPVPLVCP